MAASIPAKPEPGGILLRTSWMYFSNAALDLRDASGVGEVINDSTTPNFEMHPGLGIVL